MSRFLIVWLGQFISCIGSGLTAFALGIYVFQMTGSATSYSTVMLLAFLPSVLLRPIGGVITDMIGRRLSMIIGDLGSAAGILFILLMMFAGSSSMGVIYTGVAISSFFLALQNPAYKASVTDLVHEDNYGKASGLMQLAESSRYLIAPILAGFLIQMWKIEYVLILDVMTFVIAVFAVFAMKKETVTHEQEKTFSDFYKKLADGFRYTFSHPKLLWLLGSITLITFFVGFLQALLGPMILSFSDALTLGKIQSISASGMLISSLFIGVFSQSNNQLRVLSISLALAGIFYALLGVSTSPLFLTIAGFLFFSTLPFINTSLEVMIRKRIDLEMQGRVWSIVSLISQSGMVLALGIAGPLADMIFKPLLQVNGALVSSVGQWIGVGPGRGIGLMFLMCGVGIFLTSYLFSSRIEESDGKNYIKRLGVRYSGNL